MEKKKPIFFLETNHVKLFTNMQNFAVTSQGKEIRVERGSCLVCLFASHSDGRLDILHPSSMANFKRLSDIMWVPGWDDVRNEPERWVLRRVCFIQSKRRRHHSSSFCILLSCRLLSHRLHQLLSLLYRFFAGSRSFWQGIWGCLSSSLRLACLILGLSKSSPQTISHCKMAFSIPAVAPSMLATLLSKSRLFGVTHREENRNGHCSCLSLTGGTFLSAVV